ncbi:MAG: DUF1947 domain-containing protein [Candidatus Bathyarchaeia archaeon]|nr:DUF1947 domain-containing protein [Candidatus Bathyarchaeota archaeon]
MGGVKSRHLLKSKEKRALIKRVSEAFNIDVKSVLGEEMEIEIAELREKKALIIVINGRPLLVETNGDLIPTLFFVELVEQLPKVFVDMGAIPHICNGADIMAPGVVKVEGKFEEGDLVVVLDERHNKAIAVAKALISSEKLKGLKKGKVLKNIHYIGDSIWKTIREI